MHNQRGLTYLGLMFFIVVMGIIAATAAQQWSVILKRDREAELLFRGNRIKRAIEKFVGDYEVKKAERDHPLPRSLEELTKPTPYLANVYKDPITDQPFELLSIEGAIYGVRSRSKGKPLNRAAFQEAEAYDQIVFKVESAARIACGRGLNGPSKLDQTSMFSSSSSQRPEPGPCQPGTATPGGTGTTMPAGSEKGGQGASGGKSKPEQTKEKEGEINTNQGSAFPKGEETASSSASSLAPSSP